MPVGEYKGSARSESMYDSDAKVSALCHIQAAHRRVVCVCVAYRREFGLLKHAFQGYPAHDWWGCLPSSRTTYLGTAILLGVHGRLPRAKSCTCCLCGEYSQRVDMHFWTHEVTLFTLGFTVSLQVRTCLHSRRGSGQFHASFSGWLSLCARVAVRHQASPSCVGDHGRETQVPRDALRAQRSARARSK